MTFKPLGKRVLLERIEEATTTATGIIIPDNAKEKPLSGIVRAISPKVEEKGLVKLGDKVVFGKYAGTELTLDGKVYLVMNLDDILGVL
ncbi:co-chaperone GroES [Sulfurospirillum barnesii]|uniref:Co-chaperonin GroES n=1 Tax=Sulfurospirillum barnesii (strain ATCC 700032 / DSM 10660 / SES-3) TaxID=760154 RepID=I3XW11_SULBS|nr:co-chaperone GroES [Sulfurospirillum barnesii]AFL68135.1 Co-chaperonin GroES [Sulfurospirillum barnesii SES-3]